MEKEYLVLSNRFKVRKERFGGILFDRETHSYYQLNNTAAEILLSLERPLSIRELETELVDRLGVPKEDREIFKNYIAEFLETCEKRKIVTRSTSKQREKKTRKNVSKKLLNLPFSAPLHFTINPTFLCNLSCEFCYLSDDLIKRYGPMKMNEEDLKRIIEIANENRVFEVNIVGGEPLLYDKLYEIITYAEKLDYNLSISTNGSLPATIENIPNYKHFTIQFSLHGDSEEIHDKLVRKQGVFKKVIESIEKAKNKGIKRVVNTVLYERNRECVEGILDILDEFEITDWYISNLRYNGRAKKLPEDYFLSVEEFWETLEELERYKRKNHIKVNIHPVCAFSFVYKNSDLPKEEFYFFKNKFCKAGITKLEIMPDGQCYPCEYYYGDERFKLGNILSDPFEEIWSNKKLEVFRDSKTNEICNEISCKYTTICSGGCIGYIEQKGLKVDDRCPNIRMYST